MGTSPLERSREWGGRAQRHLVNAEQRTGPGPAQTPQSTGFRNPCSTNTRIWAGVRSRNSTGSSPAAAQWHPRSAPHSYCRRKPRQTPPQWCPPSSPAASPVLPQHNMLRILRPRQPDLLLHHLVGQREARLEQRRIVMRPQMIEPLEVRPHRVPERLLHRMRPLLHRDRRHGRVRPPQGDPPEADRPDLPRLELVQPRVVPRPVLRLVPRWSPASRSHSSAYCVTSCTSRCTIHASQPRGTQERSRSCQSSPSTCCQLARNCA